jgi:hypothetical protein
MLVAVCVGCLYGDVSTTPLPNMLEINRFVYGRGKQRTGARKRIFLRVEHILVVTD